MTEPALTFTTIAEDYDRYRTAYPADFIEAVLRVPGRELGKKLCEVGSGSGQATIRLLELGYDTGIHGPVAGIMDARGDLVNDQPFRAVFMGEEQFDPDDADIIER